MAQKKVTLKEIAQKTGVSLGTVHRAIYGKEGVSEETRQKVLAEVERSNYQVDEAASALKRHTRNVFVVLPKAQNEERFYFTRLWQEIRRAADEMAQYKLSFHFIEAACPLSQIAGELERVYDECLEEMDGMITVADGEQANIWVARFARRGVPVVLLSSYYVGDSPLVSCIKCDHACCGQLAAEFMGYRLRPDGKVLFLSGGELIYSNQVYAREFARGIRRLGVELCTVPGFGRDEIIDNCAHLLRTEPIQGVFSTNARGTYAVCQLLGELGLGRDMTVVGTDIFTELSPYFEEGILNAVICQNQWDQGSCAVKKINEYLTRGDAQEEEITLPPSLILKSNYPYFI